MKTDEAIKQFGNSVKALADALGITREAVYQWGETVPPLRAYQIRELIEARPAQVGADTTPTPEQQAA